MHIRRVDIQGFRGIAEGTFLFTPDCVVIGPNGCGKSTLVDALALVLGRGRLVRTLTEHDFTGSKPGPADRFRIVVTLTGFAGEDPRRHAAWFREGRAVPKWIDHTGEIHPESAPDRTLCAQIGVVGRFDYEDLTVDILRYFHDDDDGEADDPFASDAVLEEVPTQLLNQMGFFVLLSRRTWEGMVSFNSELFRRTLLEAANFPAAEILGHRDALRNPEHPVEKSPALGVLVSDINKRIARLLPGAPTLKLRLTSGDSEGVLHALQPHYASGDASLPVARHGVGLLSLQSFLLLLEVAKSRKNHDRTVILALEEPELHLAPGLSARLVSEARRITDQVICTTHSPRVASLFPATRVRIMNRSGVKTMAPPLLAEELGVGATNTDRKLFLQNRTRLIDAVMQPVVLVPEGRFDGEWLTRLAQVGEDRQTLAPFGSIFGITPTENAAIVRTVEVVRAVRQNVIALVDGDGAGDGYVRTLRDAPLQPTAVVQWPPGYTIEDIVGWILSAAGEDTIAALRSELSEWSFGTVAEFVALLKLKNDSIKKIMGMKEDAVAHDVIVGIIQGNSKCLTRCALLLDSLVAVATGIEHQSIEVSRGDALLRRFRT